MKHIITFFLLAITLHIIAINCHGQTEEQLRKQIDEDIKSDNYETIQGIWNLTETRSIKTYMNGVIKQVIPSSVGEPRKCGILKRRNSFDVYLFDSETTNYTLYPSQNGGFTIRYGEFTGTVRLVSQNHLKATIRTSTDEMENRYKDFGVVSQIINEVNLYKVYPSNDDIKEVKRKSIEEVPRSGTGFALSSDGMIVTNYHVIENAKSIKIKGLNGGFDKSFNAQVVQVDKVNDLAIIKIEDPDFKNLGTIPFKVKTSTSDVGENIFVLGFPLTTTMGEEIKLTTGVVSSKTGFQGSVTQYQISAPIQPGNSGGPLFDESGNVIGIISAKHLNTENVGYAIKASYLQSLIDLIPEKISVPNPVLVTNKPLSVQVKVVKNFIFIIEVNKE